MKAKVAILIVIILLAIGVSNCDWVGLDDDKNPSIKVTLDRVGVYDNGEGGLRDFLDPAGEIYLYIAVEDGTSAKPEPRRLPTRDYYKLETNAITDVGLEVFRTQEVGDYLRIFVTGWECDGGDFEKAVSEAVGTALVGVATGGSGFLASSLFGGLLGGLLGSDDDPMGDYEQIWGPESNWGIGQHQVDRDNIRLWFTIADLKHQPREPTYEDGAEAGKKWCTTFMTTADSAQSWLLEYPTFDAWLSDYPAFASAYSDMSKVRSSSAPPLALNATESYIRGFYDTLTACARGKQ